MIKRLVLLICFAQMAFAGRFIDDLQRVYPRGVARLNPGFDQRPSKLRSVFNFLREYAATGASLVVAEAGQELVARGVDSLLPGWPNVCLLVKEFGGNFVFSAALSLMRTLLRPLAPIEQPLTVACGVQRFDSCFEQNHALRSPVLAHCGLSPQSPLLQVMCKAEPLVARRCWPAALPLRLAMPLRAALTSTSMNGVSYLLDRFGMAQWGFKKMLTLGALYALGQRAARRLVVSHAVSLVDHYAISSLDRFFTPCAPDVAICSQMGCADCIAEVAGSVPALSDPEAAAWQACGHLCRENLNNAVVSGLAQSLCPVHTQHRLVNAIRGFANRNHYGVDAQAIELIASFNHLLCELSSDEQQQLVQFITRHAQNRMAQEVAPADASVRVDDVQAAIESVRFIQHNMPIINSFEGLTARLPEAALAMFAPLTDAQIRQVCAALILREGAITADVLAEVINGVVS